MHEIRAARRDEARAVADLWLRSRHAAVPAIPPPVHADEDVHAFFKDVVLPNRDVWVAESDGALVAMMVLEGDWIDQLYVDPAATDHGLGSELVDLAKTQCPEGLQLWAFQSNVRALRFYERHGFVATRTTDGDNEEGAPDVHYEWPGAAR